MWISKLYTLLRQSRIPSWRHMLVAMMQWLQGQEENQKTLKAKKQMKLTLHKRKWIHVWWHRLVQPPLVQYMCCRLSWHSSETSVSLCSELRTQHILDISVDVWPLGWRGTLSPVNEVCLPAENKRTFMLNRSEARFEAGHTEWANTEGRKQ